MVALPSKSYFLHIFWRHESRTCHDNDIKHIGSIFSLSFESTLIYFMQLMHCYSNSLINLIAFLLFPLWNRTFFLLSLNQSHEFQLDFCFSITLTPKPYFFIDDIINQLIFKWLLKDHKRWAKHFKLQIMMIYDIS